MPLPWLRGEAESAGLRVALLPLGPLACGYRAVARLHRGMYQHGWLSSRRLPCCVISVGSLLVGGSGKTPLSAWVALSLRRRGFRVALASRGYARVGGGRVTVVSDGEDIRTAGATAGDEPLVLVAHAPGVPVLVGPDRGVVGLRAISAFGADVIVLDDGFQHHRLQRDVDLLAFDGMMGLANQRVLPRGPLRESVSALADADALCAIDGDLSSADAQLVQRWAPDALRIRASRVASELRHIAGTRVSPATELAGRRVGMLAAIGNPASFKRSLEALGAEVVAERVFRDHHRYRAGDLLGLEKESLQSPDAVTWVTTEKDAVKLLPSWTGHIDLRVLRSALEVEAEDEVIAWLEQKVDACLRKLQEVGLR